ncbi:MAG: hypothetical protein IJL92_06085, partial [Thermoguttaceae bacterium]|nr:hypothetical protein [Thermoguttaceae bacterium]
MQSHSLCRTIVEMVNRSAQKTNSGRNKKDVKKTDSRKLTLEALESRELLSVSPWLSDDLSSVQTQQSSEPIAPISLSDANPDLAENGWNADEPLILAAAESASTRVTSLNDVVNANDGVITLREALTVYAKDGDTITFAPSLKGGTIRLRGTQITIEKSVTIDASSLYDSANNKPGLTIDASQDSRIFEIKAPATTIKGLEFVNGSSAGNGGAVCVSTNSSSFTSLTISKSSFHNNFSSGSGGALFVIGTSYSAGSVSITNSSF